MLAHILSWRKGGSGGIRTNVIKMTGASSRLSMSFNIDDLTLSLTLMKYIIMQTAQLQYCMLVCTCV
jgi:hypothetical protein